MLFSRVYTFFKMDFPFCQMRLLFFAEVVFWGPQKVQLKRSKPIYCLLEIDVIFNREYFFKYFDPFGIRKHKRAGGGGGGGGGAGGGAGGAGGRGRGPARG